jgi:hypothetical protein
MSLHNTYYYRVCDGVSNPINLITDYITRQQHNIIYKSYKQATQIANERLKERLGLAYDATIRALPELLFTEDNKADCEINGHYLRIFPLHPGIECFVAIIPIKSYKALAPAAEQQRRSARVAALQPINYAEEAEEDSDSDAEFAPAAPKHQVVAAIPDYIDLTEENDQLDNLMGGINALHVNEPAIPSVIPRRLLGGGVGYNADDDDPM